MDPGLENILQPVGILGTLGFGLVLFTKTLTDYFLRKKIVDKGLAGEDAGALLRAQNEGDQKYSALKWGLIIFFGGMGLILLEVIPYDVTSTLPYGIFAASLSLGFLIYYYLVRQMSKD